MNIWKFSAILGIGAALILFFAGINMPNTQEVLTAIVGAIGAANFALLAMIIDKLANRGL